MRFIKESVLTIMLLVCSQIESAPAGDVVKAVNLVRNGSFEQLNDGQIIGWYTKGDESVHQQLSVGAGLVTGQSAKLECSSFRRQTRLGYATVFQSCKMDFQKGQWYRFSCWARQEGIRTSYRTKTKMLFFYNPPKVTQKN